MLFLILPVLNMSNARPCARPEVPPGKLVTADKMITAGKDDMEHTYGVTSGGQIQIQWVRVKNDQTSGTVAREKKTPRLEDCRCACFCGGLWNRLRGCRETQLLFPCWGSRVECFHSESLFLDRGSSGSSPSWSERNKRKGGGEQGKE